MSSLVNFKQTSTSFFVNSSHLACAALVLTAEATLAVLDSIQEKISTFCSWEINSSIFTQFSSISSNLANFLILSSNVIHIMTPASFLYHSFKYKAPWSRKLSNISADSCDSSHLRNQFSISAFNHLRVSTRDPTDWGILNQRHWLSILVIDMWYQLLLLRYWDINELTLHKNQSHFCSCSWLSVCHWLFPRLKISPLSIRRFICSNTFSFSINSILLFLRFLLTLCRYRSHSRE